MATEDLTQCITMFSIYVDVLTLLIPVTSCSRYYSARSATQNRSVQIKKIEEKNGAHLLKLVLFATNGLSVAGSDWEQVEYGH